MWHGTKKTPVRCQGDLSRGYRLKSLKGPQGPNRVGDSKGCVREGGLWPFIPVDM